MAGLISEIKIEPELRPCIIKTEIPITKDRTEIFHNALFHCWEVCRTPFYDEQHFGELVAMSFKGLTENTVAIVEYEDGTIHECYPHEIQFIDGKINEYCFEQVGKVDEKTDF